MSLLFDKFISSNFKQKDKQNIETLLNQNFIFKTESEKISSIDHFNSYKDYFKENFINKKRLTLWLFNYLVLSDIEKKLSFNKTLLIPVKVIIKFSWNNKKRQEYKYLIVFDIKKSEIKSTLSSLKALYFKELNVIETIRQMFFLNKATHRTYINYNDNIFLKKTRIIKKKDLINSIYFKTYDEKDETKKVIIDSIVLHYYLIK